MPSRPPMNRALVAIIPGREGEAVAAHVIQNFAGQDVVTLSKIRDGEEGEGVREARGIVMSRHNIPEIVKASQEAERVTPPPPPEREYVTVDGRQLRSDLMTTAHRQRLGLPRYEGASLRDGPGSEAANT